MRTLILTLTVLLLAAPVWATVEITLSRDGDVVTIGYTTDEGLVRAFALDIVATGGNITAIEPTVKGDDNGGYGIFPGSFDDTITVDPGTGLVDDWNATGYSPLAPPDDTGALGPIPGPEITIELGSLYPEGGNAPSDEAGELCTITVESTVTKVCVEANAIRGNVVLEDANEPAELIVGCIGGECFPSGYTTYADWVTYGKPDCWCEPPFGSGYQCDGDADGATYGYQKYRVYTPDLTLMVNNWKLKIGDVGIDPCADFDHKPYGYQKYRVYTPDLTILVNNWKKYDVDNLTKPVEERLPGDCPRPE